MAIELGRGARARTGHQLPALIRRLRRLDRLRDPRQELRAGAAPPRGLGANGETARPAGRSGTNPGTHRGASPPLQTALAPPPARPGAPARLGPWAGQRNQALQSVFPSKSVGSRRLAALPSPTLGGTVREGGPAGFPRTPWLSARVAGGSLCSGGSLVRTPA